MIRVMHLIVGLGTGGAETNLYRLVKGIDRSTFENIVVCLLPPGPVGDAIEECGVPVRSLRLIRGVPNPIAILKLARLIREWKPDILQTWMYHADLLGGITAKILSSPPVVWNIRASDIIPSSSARTVAAARLCARLSSLLPARIISCSIAGRDSHVRMGYEPSRLEVIFNGYDSNYYRPDPGAAAALRNELNIPEHTGKLIAMIARYHPVKDHACFLAAAHEVHIQAPHVCFILCGEGITWENQELVGEIDRYGLRTSVFLLGGRADVNKIMAAASLVVSSSSSEGFPNVLAEAMACGTMCVATDVGDSRQIIGDTGFLVPPQHPKELASAIVRALQEPASAEALQNPRNRIISNFSIEGTIRKYESLYRQVANNRRLGAAT